jgi:hypothetical protein
VVLRCFADLPVGPEDLTGFETDPGEEIRLILSGQLNDVIQLQKREKMEALSAVFNRLERRQRTADALRKWTSGRLEELVSLMNGKPPKSAYSVEILLILMEKAEYPENSE